ncbi:MAG: adenosylcobalamin-dependent ribonucleoside-diphosphate reductase [Promethearchaeota archaeon]
MELNQLALSILQERYLLRNEMGEVMETPSGMLERVATTVARVNEGRIGEDKFEEYLSRIQGMLEDLEFLPNSPTLMNAGTIVGQLSACFVLPVDDSIDGIFDAVKNMAVIHKSGGGTGFSFSELRPKGDIINTSMGHSSGPISFMGVFDATTNAITQGGRRRGANMGILNVNHPDIEEFIEIKTRNKHLENFSLSVSITDEFMECVQDNTDFPLINPRNQKITRHVNAQDLFDKIARSAWECGDPGIIFIDEINRKNPTPKIGPITTTNPCGEIPLYSFESCNLGSINLTKVVNEEAGTIEWDKLQELTIAGVEFLDNVIDVNKYPLPEIESETKKNRKIGLGVMGFADMLIMLGIKYTSSRALETGRKVMKFINDAAREESIRLGEERGNFPNFTDSIYNNETRAMRNATRTAIAPTGTISIIAGVSSGIEPLFSLYHRRNVQGIGTVEYFHPLLVDLLESSSHPVDAILEKVKNAKGIDQSVLPEPFNELFIPAFNVEAEHHIRIQSAFQANVDNSVSKTVNLPEHASIDDVKDCFQLAWELKCKGIAVYRYNSKTEQVLSLE